MTLKELKTLREISITANKTADEAATKAEAAIKMASDAEATGLANHIVEAAQIDSDTYAEAAAEAQIASDNFITACIKYVDEQLN